jgi:hypothetical protein
LKLRTAGYTLSDYKINDEGITNSTQQNLWNSREEIGKNMLTGFQKSPKVSTKREDNVWEYL